MRVTKISGAFRDSGGDCCVRVSLTSRDVVLTEGEVRELRFLRTYADDDGYTKVCLSAYGLLRRLEFLVSFDNSGFRQIRDVNSLAKKGLLTTGRRNGFEQYRLCLSNEDVDNLVEVTFKRCLDLRNR